MAWSLKERFLRVGGLPLPISFLILSTKAQDILAHNFRKD